MKRIIDDVLVVKVGTSTLIERSKNDKEQLDHDSFRRIGQQVLNLKEQGTHVALVSSAAITAGMMATGLDSACRREQEMGNLQRLSSIGWRHVLNAWASAMGDETIGELLLTKHELELKQERQETLQTTHWLMSHGNTTVINENDAITHEQIAFGDNDTLAANYAARLRGSAMFGKNIRLLLLSDINGVRRDVGDPQSVISNITDLTQYQHLAQGAISNNGTGGMVTKFGAAQIALESGVDMWIADGREEDVIERALSGETGTHFSCVDPRSSSFSL